MGWDNYVSTNLFGNLCQWKVEVDKAIIVNLSGEHAAEGAELQFPVLITITLKEYSSRG